MTIKTIDTYDTEGAFVLVAESKTQGPIVLETEGEFSSREAAQKRQSEMRGWMRTCICRLVPVSGNELLVLDLIRMQPKPEQEDNPF